MSADSDAFQTVKQLPGLTPAEQQYLLAVARGEGFYGLGWGNPSQKTIDESAQFGIDPRAGVGSNNWGAEQGSGSAGSFPHIDHRSDGSAYVGTYKRHNTSAEGAASVARILLKPNVRLALKEGFYPGPTAPDRPSKKKHFEAKQQFAGQTLSPLQAAVFTQHDNGYYELSPFEYEKAVRLNYEKLTANLGWPALLLSTPLAPRGTVDATPLAGSPSSSSQESSGGEHSKLLERETNPAPHEHAVLRQGDKGGKVRYLQSLLPGCKVDGLFGPKTNTFVLVFQEACGLKPDGIVGPKTWRELEDGKP